MFRIAVCLCAALSLCAQTAPPKTWIDPATGHRVFRLTDEPGSASLYFNQNGYSADGKKLIYTTPQGISTFDLATHATRSVVEGRVRVIVTGRKSQSVYYTRNGTVYATDVDTLATREIAKLPARNGVSVPTVNADETLLAGTYIENGGQDYNSNRSQQPQQQSLIQPPNKGQMMEQRLAAHLPMAMFTINTKTGELKVIHRATDWLNHLEFSPTDPTLLMFCHEGPWHKVDRIWTIRTDGVTAYQGPHPDDGHGDFRARVLESRREDHLVRPADGRAARTSGLPGTTWRRGSARGITCSGTSGRSTSMSLPMARCFAGMAATPARWPRLRMANGSTCSAPN